MAKKIRFPLIMDKDAEVRNLEELRENFSLRAVLEYYENGKLLTWLENLYLLDEADQIRELDKEAPDFQRRLCGIFQVEYTRDMDPKVIEQRKKRLERLRNVTDEDEFYRMIDYVAFDQEELVNLLEKGEKTICLCREEGKDFTFIIPASCKGVTYIGVITQGGQKPRVCISGGTLEYMQNLGIMVKQMLAYKNILLEGGTVVATGNNDYNQCNVSTWQDIVSIACGPRNVIGLKKDGTIVTTDFHGRNQISLSTSRDIVSIAWGYGYRVGLKKDGTVVATGSNYDYQCEVSTWRDIISIACGNNYTVGLKKDGTIVATGSNFGGRCDVSTWRDIVSIACGGHTVGLKKDGTVVATGNNDYGQCDVSTWRNIVSIACGGHTVGLKKDGTVAATGNNDYGQCDVSTWRDIVSIACGALHTVGLKKDGTVVATGCNNYGQCDVSTWRDIVSIACGCSHTVAIQKTHQ